MISSLSTELHNLLCQALLLCDEFDNTMRLQGDLAKFNRVFERAYGKKEELVTSTIIYLTRQRLPSRKPVLPLFLMVLHDMLGENDELRDEFEELHTKVELELGGTTGAHNPPSQSTVGHVHVMVPVPAPSLASPVIAGSINGRFLEPDERREIIQYALQLIEIKSNAGRKNMLLACGFDERTIGSLRLDDPPLSVAEEMVGLAETRDRPYSTLTYLEEFVLNLVKEFSHGGTPSEARMKEIVARYNYKRNVYRDRAQSNRSYPPLKPADVAINEERKRITDAYRASPQISSLKIDKSKIVKFNLLKQKGCFAAELDGRYTGFFTFAIASVNYTVLKNYVLDSLLRELAEHTSRPNHLLFDIYLYLDQLDCSNAEQCTISIEKAVRKWCRGKSLRDLLEDRQDADLAVVLRFEGNVPPNFNNIAIQFSETVKAQVNDILHNRCFVLFWANYGPVSPLEPLAVSVALPACERLEVDHVIGWLDTWLGRELKSQNVPEQEINYCRERLVEKIKYHDGRLPGTYECLLEPLELGGAF